jgi:hypothetical protein
MSAPATFLPRYYELLDENGLNVLPTLAPDFTFSILWTVDGESHEFAGGLDEFNGYMAQRDPAGQLHHLLTATRVGHTELAAGWTTRYGEWLGTFSTVIQLNADEKLTHLFSARTTAFQYDHTAIEG